MLSNSTFAANHAMSRSALPGALYFATLTLSILLIAPQPTAAVGFADISASIGLTETDFTYGQAWGDLDGDGDYDLVVGRHFLPPIVYENLGGNAFNPIFPFTLPGDHHGMVIVDFDDDGDPDVYLTGGVQGGTSVDSKHLYRNDGGFVFQDIGLVAGLADTLARGRAVSAIDLESDGDLDLFVAKARRGISPNSLFVNDGTGQYTDVAATSGVADATGSEGGIWGDYDRDGDPDLFVSGIEHPLSGSRLYRNDGNLAFTDVTATALPGLGPAAAAAWGDYDNDGDLDLAIGLGDEGIYDGVQVVDSDEIVFFFNARATENGVDVFEFTQPSDEARFELQFQGEFQADKVFISSTGFNPIESKFDLTMAQAAGMPTFTPGVSVGFYLWTDPQAGTWHMTCSTPASIGSNFSGTIRADEDFTSLTFTDLEAPDLGPRGARLWRNDGGTFTDVTVASSISDALNVRNVTWLDFDLDGDLDLHVNNKGDTESSNHPDVLYSNQNGVFTDVTAAQGIQGPADGLSDGISFEDSDGDGDLDAAIISGASPRFFALQEIHRIFENLNGGQSLRVDLVGLLSTRDGLGSWVTCVSSVGRQVRYVAANAWRGSQTMIDPLFGLQGAVVVDSLIVDWPSGMTSVLTNVPAGIVTVTEPAPTDAPLSDQFSSAFDVRVYPNPSVGSVALEVLAEDDREYTLEIVTATGRRVLSRRVAATQRRVVWDGRDAQGAPVAAGVYYAIVRDAAAHSAKRVVRLR